MINASKNHFFFPCFFRRGGCLFAVFFSHFFALGKFAFLIFFAHRDAHQKKKNREMSDFLMRGRWYHLPRIKKSFFFAFCFRRGVDHRAGGNCVLARSQTGQIPEKNPGKKTLLDAPQSKKKSILECGSGRDYEGGKSPKTTKVPKCQNGQSVKWPKWPK